MTARRADTQIVLVRHAPAAHGGRLCGRTDVAAVLPPEATLASVRGAIGPIHAVLSSPAQRCRQTAEALWPTKTGHSEDPRLWEQDFGDWEGTPFEDLPDLGEMSGAELADHRPPGGESFSDLCARVEPVLRGVASGQVAIVAHAGVVRAGLALALGCEAQGLLFEVAPLSVTRLKLHGGVFSIHSVNWRAPS